jgi:hypothetical protein
MCRWFLYCFSDLYMMQRIISSERKGHIYNPFLMLPFVLLMIYREYVPASTKHMPCFGRHLVPSGANVLPLKVHVSSIGRAFLRPLSA